MSTKPNNGFSKEENGWLYISVSGAPRERGYAYGYYCAKEMADIQKMLKFVVLEETGEEWEFFIEAGKTMYKQTLQEQFPEYYEEMEGIAEGCKAGGTHTTVDEIIAWNNYFALTGYWFPNREGEDGKIRSPHSTEGGGAGRRGGGPGAQDRCSAFIANGDYTTDGQLVMVHNNFSNFVDGQFARVVLDIKPTEGHRILMQTFACWIWSGTDFYVTSKGLVGGETTMGGFLPFENNYPISVRIRKVMQYADTLDDCVSILLDGNSGDYANAWMFGDINTNEIMLFELGLKYHNVKRTKNGYFIGFNAPYDPKIRNLECSNTGFDDLRRHQGARRVRLADLMDEHKGKIDLEVAKLIIADHYDVYLGKENPCSRTICSHYELDAREYMSDPSRPKPFQPRGALDGCVITAEQAKNMSFTLRYGDSCGIPFDAKAFCKKNRIWEDYLPYLRDRPTQPWTLFTIAPDTDTTQANKSIAPKTLKKKQEGGNRKAKRSRRKYHN